MKHPTPTRPQIRIRPRPEPKPDAGSYVNLGAEPPVKADAVDTDARSAAILRTLREKRKLTVRDLARRASTTAIQIQKLESGSQRMTLDWIARLSAALECQPSEFLPGPDASHDNRMPVYRVYDPLSGGHRKEKLEGEFVARPPALKLSASAYAVYMPNGAMEPRFRAGELLYVNPSLPVTAGCSAILEVESGTASIVEIIRVGSTILLFRELNPATEFECDLDQIKSLDRIVGTSELIV